MRAEEKIVLEGEHRALTREAAAELVAEMRELLNRKSRHYHIGRSDIRTRHEGVLMSQRQ